MRKHSSSVGSPCDLDSRATTELQRLDPTMNPMARAAAVAWPGFARTHWTSISAAAAVLCAPDLRFVGRRRAKKVETTAAITIAIPIVAAAAAGGISKERDTNAA